MIEIQEDLYVRIKNLLRVLTSSCKGCVRRGKPQCDECDIAPAPYLLSRLENVMKPNGTVDYGRRFDIIESQVRSFGRPVLAKEIDPKKKLCGRGLKYWSLRKMVEIGMLKSFRQDKQVYFIPNN